MTTLYHFAAPVKSTHAFGSGILPTRPSYRTSHTADDAAWWAAESARLEAEAREIDRIVDEMHAEAELERLYLAGVRF